MKRRAIVTASVIVIGSAGWYLGTQAFAGEGNGCPPNVNRFEFGMTLDEKAGPFTQQEAIDQVVGTLPPEHNVTAEEAEAAFNKDTTVDPNSSTVSAEVNGVTITVQDNGDGSYTPVGGSFCTGTAS